MNVAEVLYAYVLKCLLNVDFTGHLDKTLLLAMNLEKELKKTYHVQYKL